MKIICVDDEKNALENFEYFAQNRDDISSVNFFLNPAIAVEYIKTNEVDVAFLDISMPVMSGLELTKELHKINPDIEIVFITGYTEYTLEAFKNKARAYLTKPYTGEELNEVLDLVSNLVKGKKFRYHSEHIKKEGNIKPPEPILRTSTTKNIMPAVFVRTFGNFDLLYKGEVVEFKNAKSKELLAFLVDRRGGSITSRYIFTYLWEDKEYNAVTSTYVRRATTALVSTLKDLGIEYIIKNSRNSKSVDVTKFECDYYDIMAGNDTYLFEYNGYYMNEYSWAEETIPIIDAKTRSLKHLR